MLVFVYEQSHLAFYQQGGTDPLNSWRLSHVNRIRGWHHHEGVTYPLITQAHGQDRLSCHQGYTPTLDGERSVGQEWYWRRENRLPWTHPSVWTMRLYIRQPLWLPAWYGKSSNRPGMDVARINEAPPLITQEQERHIQQGQGGWNLPEEPARLFLRRHLPGNAKNTQIGYTTKMTIDLIRQFYSHDACIFATKMLANDDQLRFPYNLEEPHEGLIKTLDKCANFVAEESWKDSETQLVHIAYGLVTEIGQYPEDCWSWRTQDQNHGRPSSTTSPRIKNTSESISRYCTRAAMETTTWSESSKLSLI